MFRKNNKMRLLFFKFILLLLFSCNQIEQISTTSDSDSLNKQDSLCINVALAFINDYINFCNLTKNTIDSKWIKNNTLLSDNFKVQYYSLIDSAYKNDPELGLGFDPIFDSQDFPDKGFEFEKYDHNTGLVTLKGKDWQEFKLVLKVIKYNNQSMVDGCGIINIPSNQKAKR